MNIGERIRILRQNLNMSMEELANILGKTRPQSIGMRREELIHYR